MNKQIKFHIHSKRLLFVVFFFTVVFVHTTHTAERNKLAIPFEGKYGQIEIGGRYVGAEFHNSFPLPSRVSFFYPVANSIDISSDYWRRGFESHPYSLLLSIDGITEAIGMQPWKYEWTPFYAMFNREEEQYNATIEYRFAEDIPVMVVRMRFVNKTSDSKEFRVFTGLSLSVRTSHTFALRDKAALLNFDTTSVVIGYPDRHADSTAVFVLNTGTVPVNWSGYGIRKDNDDTVIIKQPRAVYDYIHLLVPGEAMEIIHIVGSCRMSEWNDVVGESLERWEESVNAYEQRVMAYALDPVFVIDRPEHMQTLRWSRALLETNLHYIDGAYAPMPCPAEYNFYFTHDMLLTNLGSVIFDVERVRDDLFFLQSLTGPDNILPHAYYWKDGDYRTEYAGADNWNHLWFIILLNSYLLHSGDAELSASLYPVAARSLQLIFENYRDGLMYASRPDWWDIGNVYGARSYLTILTVRAVDSFASLTLRLGEEEAAASSYLEKSEVMKQELINSLWDDDAGYLLNMFDLNEVDRHYYAGSLLAIVFNSIDREKQRVLLETAQRELLDENIGIRNVMPADFHELIDAYQFKGMEAGEPFQYINGGVWPHGNAWYALGLLAAGMPDEAESVVRKYMTLEGISNSPRGQPSFFEYRNADSKSVRYGEIDKPSFLWAGGWYLHVLYRLAGVRENGWNISFDPHIPAVFDSVQYSVWNKGEKVDVGVNGTGKYFKRIVVNGERSYSAVLHRNIRSLLLERGNPVTPYLADAGCIVSDVRFNQAEISLQITGHGVTGQSVRLSVVSPLPVVEMKSSGGSIMERSVRIDGTVYLIDIVLRFDKTESIVTLQFY